MKELSVGALVVKSEDIVRTSSPRMSSPRRFPIPYSYLTLVAET